MPYFNPRTREGCDVNITIGKRDKYYISIHAPVKGATFRFNTRVRGDRHFNPRTREGCDPAVLQCPPTPI